MMPVKRLMTMRELRTLLREDDEDLSINLMKEDFQAILRSEPKPRRKQGGTQWVAFKLLDDAVPRTRPDRWIRQRWCTPQTLMEALKRGSVEGMDKRHRFVCSDEVRAAMVDEMAVRLSTLLMGEGIELITEVDSTKSFVGELAAKLSEEMLLGVRHVPKTNKKASTEAELDQAFDPDEETLNWTMKHGKSDEEMLNKLALLQGQKNAMRKAIASGQAPEAKKLRNVHRDQISIHVITPNAGELRGKHVLLVDDNIDRGTTLTRLHARLLQAGARKVTLAAGWDMTK